MNVNPAVVALRPSLIRDLHGRREPGDIDLGLGQASEMPAMAPFEAALRWVAENGCRYTPNAGAQSLRQAIADYRGAKNLGAGDNVIVTHGSQEALYLCLKSLLGPGGGEVLIVGPAYGAYGKLCTLEGIPHRVINMEGDALFAPDPKLLLDAISPETRLILVASPSNPTGRVWTKAQAKTLAEGLKARPGPPIWLVVDEVYRTLTYVEDSADFADVYGATLIVGGLSKSHALTGLRIGWMIGPEEVIALCGKVHQQVTTVTSTFSQRVALEVLKTPGTFDESRERWGGRRRVMEDILKDVGLDHAPLDGAFYAWVSMGGAYGGDSLKGALNILEETRVVTIPGAAFGPGGEGWIRLSYAGGMERLAEGVGRVAEVLGGRP